jgi:hypothetical protein
MIFMPKKIKEENGNVYVVKKPLYKRVWFWVLAILAIIVIAGTIGGGSDPDTSSASESKSSSNNKVITQNTEFRKAFDNIAVGDLMSHGDGGTALSDVEKALGKPSSTSTQDVQGVQIKNYIWSKGGVSITVEFNGDQAVSKGITGFKFSRTPKFDLDAYNSLADGSSYDNVVSKYGEPDGLSEMIIGGEKTVSATWITGTKGGTITLSFTNDSLTSKAQSGLK